jgi:hypothetical protein
VPVACCERFDPDARAAVRGETSCTLLHFARRDPRLRGWDGIPKNPQHVGWHKLCDRDGSCRLVSVSIPRP